MMTEDEIGFPVQDTLKESTSSEMDSGYYTEAPLSIEETAFSQSIKRHGSKPKDSGENSVTSTDNGRYGDDAINIDRTLGGRCASEDPGGDRQENMECSCLNSKALEDTSRTEDTSMRRDNSTMSCALENSAPIDPVSWDDTVEGLQENNLAPEDHGSVSNEAELLEPKRNCDVGPRPSDDMIVYHEVNKYFSSASHIDGNASNFKTNDGTNKDTYSNTTYSELQDVADVDKNKDTEQENKTSTDHERNNIDFSYYGLNIKKGKGKVFDGTSPNDKSSTGRQQDNNVTKVITSGDQSTMIVNSENSTTTSLDDEFSLEIHRSTNIAKKLHEPEQTGGNVSNIKPDVSSEIDANSTTKYSELQVGAAMSKNNITEPKSKTSTDHRGNNIDLSGNEPNIREGKSKAFDGTSPNALAPTSPAYFQQDGEVSVVSNLDHSVSFPCGTETGSPCETKKDKPNCRRISSSAYKFRSDSFRNVLMIVLLVAPVTVQAPPVPGPKQPYYFNMSNVLSLNQTVIIRKMDTGEAVCTCNITEFPSHHNCSQPGYSVIAYNGTYIVLMTDDEIIQHYNMEYTGEDVNGEYLKATPGERLDDKSIEDMIAGITKPTDSTPRTQEDTKPGWIIGVGVGVPAGLVAIFIAAFVWLCTCCPRFKGWVQSSVSSCRRRNTNNDPEADADPNHEMEALASPTTNGSVNGHLGNEV